MDGSSILSHSGDDSTSHDPSSTGDQCITPNNGVYQSHNVTAIDCNDVTTEKTISLQLI